MQKGVAVGEGVTVAVGVPVGVPVTVMVALGVTVTVPVISATGVGETTSDSGVGTTGGEDGPIRLESIMKAAPTPKAKRATTAVMLTHNQVERDPPISSSSGTMSKSSSSDKKLYAFWLYNCFITIEFALQFGRDLAPNLPRVYNSSQFFKHVRANDVCAGAVAIIRTFGRSVNARARC